VRQYRFTGEHTQVQMRTDRTKHAPFGLFGGEASRTTRITIESNGETRAMPGKFITNVSAGDVLRVEMPGAGGWGEPLEREPRSVLEDFREGRVSRGRAYEKYGVVLTEDGDEVDVEATAQRRADLSLAAAPTRAAETTRS
jgi:N-methylhydantoinase B